MADALTADDRHSASPPRTGAVILTRHGEPALSRKVRLSAAEYRAWWAKYEEGGLLGGQTPPEKLKVVARQAGVIIASTRRRAQETAQAVTAGRAFANDPMFIEAPLPPPYWPDWIKFSPRSWGFIARVWWWFFDHHDGQESRAQAQVRADEAARTVADLAAKGDDVLVLAHGFFNTMVGNSLKAQGWKCTSDEGFKYWCARKFEKR